MTKSMKKEINYLHFVQIGKQKST